MAGDKMNKLRTKIAGRNADLGKSVKKQGAGTCFFHHDSGFTLAEVMIALVVLLLGMLGVLGMQFYAVTGNASSRELRIATSLSLEIIEQMKATPFSNLSAGSDTPLPADEITISGGVNFNRRWWFRADCVGMTLTGDNGTCNAAFVPVCATDPDAALTVAVSAVRARTCWTDKNGINHSVTLDSVRWDEDVVP